MSNDTTIEEKTAKPTTSPGRAQRSFAHLQNCRGFQELEHDRDGPTLIQIFSMQGALTWRRVSGRRSGAMYQQAEP